jgi:Lamin Tail Domain/Secretion system C-terminal sorting domain
MKSLLLSLLLLLAGAASAQIRITEYMYNGGGTGLGEFVELTNVGSTAISMAGWSFDDNSRIAGSESLAAFGTVQPGESVIFTELAAEAFRTAWAMPTSVKIIGGNTNNLGRSDEINIYDNTNTLIDRLTYNDATGGPRTVAVSGWTQRANLGANTITTWVLSAVNDTQFSWTATGGEIGSPGGYFKTVPRTLLTFVGTGLNVAEGGATATYTLALANAPTANVTVTPNPGSQLTVSPTTLTFTPANFATAQTVTVTAVDDALVEGTQSVTITHGFASTDAGYNAATARPVSVTIADNDVAGGAAPTITLASTTTAYLNPPIVSGVINDPTDPAATLGINFTLTDTDTPVNNLVLSRVSSNQSVVGNANLVVSGTGASRTLKITPTGVGYATITVTVSDGTNTANYVISYAASAASATPTTSRFLTGTSDASTAIVVDANYMFVGDDENQGLRLYNRQNSGMPVARFDFTSSLGLTDISGGIPREVDIEASVRTGNRIFWIGSQSNKELGPARPNRNRVFATDLSGTGATATLTYVGRYDFLREDITNWDATNGHGKGANYYGLTLSADAATDSKSSAGYNIEGAEFAPNGTTVYIGFRAPQILPASRTKALIVPVTNLTTLVSGQPQGSATFGAPIEMDLGGRGIREIRRNTSNEYVIIAGPPGDATGTPPLDFRLYTWTGNPADAPLLRTATVGIEVDGSWESILEVPNPLTNASQIQFLIDNGGATYYNDGTAAKDLTQNNFKKFRSEIVTLGSSVAPLPVTYLDFGAKYQNGQVAVSWATATERDNAYFEIERSADAVIYAAVGRVPGKGLSNSRQQYNLADETPLSGTSYYRLRQVDTDGTFAVSRPVSVLNEGLVGTMLRLFPNPASGVVTIQTGTAPINVRVSNAIGQWFTLPVNNNILNISNLPTGAYLIEVKTADGRTLRQRFVKE